MINKKSLFIGFTGGAVMMLVFLVLLANRSKTMNEDLVTSEISDRDVYYPGTEQLASDEMRVIALGTGTPNFRRSQASSSWLVELGNGDKFIFGIGTGSLGNLGALEIPYTYLDKVFISTDAPWPANPPTPAGPPDPSERTKLSEWLEAGRIDLIN